MYILTMTNTKRTADDVCSPFDATLSDAHRANARRAGYRVLLSFTREHTRGTLAGMSTCGTLTFVRETDAGEWLAKINRPRIAERNGYRVTTWTVRAL